MKIPETNRDALWGFATAALILFGGVLGWAVVIRLSFWILP